MKPYIHAESSAKKFGGKPEDYIEIHNWFDSSKAFIATWIHRALYHHTAGIFLAEKLFGVTITNSDNLKVSVRDIGEQHVSEDFGGSFIPTPQDYLQNIKLEAWMGGQAFKENVKKKGAKKNKVPSMPPISIDDIVFDGSTIPKPIEEEVTDYPPSYDKKPNRDGLID